MLLKDPFRKKIKTTSLLFALQILFLIFSLCLVLWGKKKLQTQPFKKKDHDLERKAQFIVPDKD